MRLYKSIVISLINKGYLGIKSFLRIVRNCISLFLNNEVSTIFNLNYFPNVEVFKVHNYKEIIAILNQIRPEFQQE